MEATPNHTTNTADEPCQSAADFCLQRLARREYSQHELRYQLKNQSYTEPQIVACLAYLSDNNYQSNTRFAEMLVRTRIGQRYGIKKIHYELLQKGIDEHLAANALADYHDKFIENAQQLISRKAPRGDISTVITDWKLKSKITRFLVGKGYDYDTINTAFDLLQSEYE